MNERLKWGQKQNYNFIFKTTIKCKKDPLILKTLGIRTKSKCVYLESQRFNFIHFKSLSRFETGTSRFWARRHTNVPPCVCFLTLLFCSLILYFSFERNFLSFAFSFYSLLTCTLLFVLTDTFLKLILYQFL